MSDSTSSTPSPIQKKSKRNLIVAAVAVIVVVALIAVVFLGGFLNSGNEDKTALQEIKDRGKLIVGTNVPWEPFEFYNLTSGQYEGFDMDVIRKVAQAIGVDVEIRSMEFDALIGAVQSGQIDVAISSITIRPDRAASVDFSTPYYIADQAVLVHDSSTIASIDDLNGTKISAQLGTTGSFWITDNLDATGQDYPDIVSAVQVVENQQDGFVACILDTPVAERYAADTNYNLKIAFVIPTNEQYGIACPKGETELVKAIDDAINAMKADGSLDSTLDKWV
ncbi:MAG: cystine transporter subunit [Methanomassiliicoccales archaeon PtaB.Bin215]|nr:MAG: cystine transporter subunit [Methanomassiliicoccales archaeon PtaB.Bin215]